MTEAQNDELVEAAARVRGSAYVPYSHFAVGAALRGADGRIYTGCNVENASFGLTICAERNALAHAISEDERQFSAIAVVTGNGVTPCGACRQVLSEFNPRMTVIVVDEAGKRRIYRLDQLLPAAFGPEQLPAVDE